MKTFIGNVWVGPFLKLAIEVDEPEDSTFQQSSEIYQRMLNLKPILEKFPEYVIFPSVLKTFAAGGRPSWVFMGFQSDPPMVKSGLMKQGLTQRDPMLNTIEVTKSSMEFYLNEAPYRAANKGNFFYPEAQQLGSKIHHSNPVINLQSEDIEKMKELIVDYVLTGNLGGLSA